MSPFAPEVMDMLPDLGTGVPESTALEGDLGRFVAGDVLQFLRLAGASGRLTFERHGERVEMAFTHGHPLWASTSGRGVRVGDVLVHRGWATKAEFEEALEIQHARPERRIGELLRERGVPAECVAESVAEVFRRLVCLLSLWPDGRFQFVPGDGAVGDDAELELELDRLLLEGLHQADLTQGTA